ncbi:hypothetical protein AX17_001974 [Amanita inopinata Kibby_2008]|nr:hypothetical protein AX17_001974 [Amanita inopinata Kibby_2008]
MFPVGDLNLVVAGLATVAATVGYACKRKFNTGSIPHIHLAEPRNLSVETAQSSMENLEEKRTGDTKTHSKSPASSSLKRKRPQEDDLNPITANLEYPHNLANIYPVKRARTPTLDSRDTTDKHPTAESDDRSSRVSPKDISITNQRASSDESTAGSPRELPPTKEKNSGTADKIVTGNEVSQSTGDDQSSSAKSPKKAPATASEQVSELPSPPPSPQTVNTQIKAKDKSSPSPTRSNGFAAYAGTASPFASKTPIDKTSVPAWITSVNEDNYSPNGTGVDFLSPVPIAMKSREKHALTKAKATGKPIIEYVTGEENETVELELKGAKLFIKRGDKPFSGGMVGHFKLLAGKENTGKRLLFRREPLWKVSMNVWFNNTVHCSFDEEEHVIRIVLKETVESSDASQKDAPREVVVYALKPSRACSRRDFDEFANALISHPRNDVA